MSHIHEIYQDSHTEATLNTENIPFSPTTAVIGMAMGALSILGSMLKTIAPAHWPIAAFTPTDFTQWSVAIIGVAVTAFNAWQWVRTSYINSEAKRKQTHSIIVPQSDDNVQSYKPKKRS